MAKRTSAKRIKPSATKRSRARRIPDREEGKTLLGMPLRTRWQKGMLAQRLWDPRDDAVLFPPKSLGLGWSLNFAYPLIQTKPVWARALAFVFCLALLLLLLWALVSLALIAYYLLSAWLAPQPAVDTISVVLE
jgi:hypothetical protein